MCDITLDMLVKEIANATKKSFIELFANGERYYYCTLVTTGEAYRPFIVAWSIEALAREVEKSKNATEKSIKWSYADSPYLGFNDKNFQIVDELFNLLPQMDDMYADDDELDEQYEFRLLAMELALKQVDDDGIFALNQPRSEVYINVEVMPPDETNTLRALRLNKPEHIVEWLDKIAEKGA